MATSFFVELSIIITLALVVSGLLRLFRQPLIIGYIITGVLAGPYALNLMSSQESITTFAEIGIAVLLFIVGLNLNPRAAKDYGNVAVIAGIGQIVFTSLISLAILLALGFSLITSLYLAVAVTFSSTIIITKLLSDRGELDALYGRISIGFLIIQDIVAMGILLVVSSVSAGDTLTQILLNNIVKGVGLAIALYLIGDRVLPKITKAIAHSQEYLLLFSIGWCMAVASLFYAVNFSMEVGALLAGITLAMSPYRHEISFKLKPLRDFFIVLFFIILGSQMIFADVVRYLVPAIVLSLFILVGNPLIVLLILGKMGYHRRIGFYAGLTVAQISEFSLILMAMAVRIGHVPSDILSLITVVGLVTFVGSTYLILYADRIYGVLGPYLKIFERKANIIDPHASELKEKHDVVLIGCNRIGLDILHALTQIHKTKVLVIDYDPDVVDRLQAQGIDSLYGDAGDTELLEELDLNNVKMVISSSSDTQVNLLLIDKLRRKNPRIIIINVAHHTADALRLYEEGSSYVLMPHLVASKHFSTMLESTKFELERFFDEKLKHVTYLQERTKKKTIQSVQKT